MCWRRDESGFSGRMLDHLVSHVDARLGVALSAGLPLQHFVMQRRIQAALGCLRDHDRPISHVAIDLVARSPSHFARMFAAVTGMTPATYRKQFRPTPG